MSSSILEQVFRKEFDSFSSKLATDKKLFILNRMLTELDIFIENEEFSNFEIKKQQYIIGNSTRWCLFELSRFSMVDLSDEQYKIIIELLSDSLFKVIMTCVEAEFDKDERLSIIKEESKLASRLAISVLKDQEEIDDKLYNKCMGLIK